MLRRVNQITFNLGVTCRFLYSLFIFRRLRCWTWNPMAASEAETHKIPSSFPIWMSRRSLELRRLYGVARIATTSRILSYKTVNFSRAASTSRDGTGQVVPVRYGACCLHHRVRVSQYRLYIMYDLYVANGTVARLCKCKSGLGTISQMVYEVIIWLNLGISFCSSMRNEA